MHNSLKKQLSALLLLAAPCFGTAFATTLTGTVTVDGSPRPGVVVSDGINVVLTDSKGAYSMSSDGRQYVFVSVPSDCELPLKNGRPAFYQAIDTTAERDRADFHLKAGDGNKDFTLVALADVQIGYKKDYTDLRDTVMPHLADSVAGLTGKVYGISLGDLVWNNPDFYGLYNEQIDRLGIPVLPVIGNHDHNEITKGDTESDREFRDNMGPNYYSLNIGDCHIVAIDNIIYSGAKGRNDYRCGITDEQLEWLKKDLEHVGKDKTLIVGMHSPTVRRNKPNYRMVNGDNFYDVVRPFTDVQILSGHTHNNNTTLIGDNIIDNTIGAVNGAFWYPICNDGSPQGYGVFRFSDGKLVDKYYKGVREPRSYQMRLYAPAEAVLWQPDAKPGDPYDKIAINIWSWDPRWKIEVCEDGRTTTLDPEKAASGMPARDPGLVKHLTGAKGTFPANHANSKPLSANTHIFLYKPADGWKTVSVRATDNFGNVYTSSLDNTAK